MKKLFKILKINILSVIALPLLLLATASKLIVKALEKVTLIFGMLFLTFLVIMGFEFIKNPGSGFQAIMYIVIFFVICFFIIAIVVLLARLAAAVIAMIWNAILAFFEGFYGVTYAGFLKLYAICETDYQYINTTGGKVANAILCLFFTLLHFLNKLIITIISFALPASILLSILLIAGSLWLGHLRVHKAFGIGLFAFLGKYDTFSLVYGIITYVVILAMIITVLLSLGVEWYEWAQEIKSDRDELENEIAACKEDDDPNEYEEDFYRKQQDYKELEDNISEEPPYANFVKDSLFFAGCNTIEKLDKRYKSLCKAYHPDAEGGDTETFQKMQEEYAQLKEAAEQTHPD